MGWIVTVHHPVLNQGEKDIRMEQIKKNTIEYMREVYLQRRNSNEEKSKDRVV